MNSQYNFSFSTVYLQNHIVDIHTVTADPKFRVHRLTNFRFARMETAQLAQFKVCFFQYENAALGITTFARQQLNTIIR